MINGPKKGSQEPTAVIDPKNGDIVVSNEEIKCVTLQYCVKNLVNESADPEVEKETNLKELLHILRIRVGRQIKGP